MRGGYLFFVDVRDLQQFGEAMAMLEADVRGDAEAIMQILSRRHRILTDNDDSNAPDVPDTPPVVPPAIGQGQEPQGQSSNHGQTSEQSEGQSSSQGEGQVSSEGQSLDLEESPMETDKPGNHHGTL